MNKQTGSHRDMASESASEDAPSPDEAQRGGAEGESQNRTKATKRSCNNCRQQKVYILLLILERTLVNLHQAQMRRNPRPFHGMFSLSTPWEDVQSRDRIQTSWEERVRFPE
jgi:hypothetical protein